MLFFKTEKIQLQQDSKFFYFKYINNKIHKLLNFLDKY